MESEERPIKIISSDLDWAQEVAHRWSLSDEAYLEYTPHYVVNSLRGRTILTRTRFYFNTKGLNDQNL